MISLDVQRRRQTLQLNRLAWQFVEADEFYELAVSRRNLVRQDEPAAALRGLLDRSTGIRYVAAEERLIKFLCKASTIEREELRGR